MNRKSSLPQDAKSVSLALMPDTNSRLYVIELKDAETGASEFVTTVDWTANQKLAAVTMFSHLSARDANHYDAHAEVERNRPPFH